MVLLRLFLCGWNLLLSWAMVRGKGAGGESIVWCCFFSGAVAYSEELIEKLAALVPPPRLGLTSSRAASRQLLLNRYWSKAYVRGLSARDIEAAFTDEDGVCLLSRSGVSEVTEVLWEEYEAFQQRDLRDIPVLVG